MQPAKMQKRISPANIVKRENRINRSTTRECVEIDLDLD